MVEQTSPGTYYRRCLRGEERRSKLSLAYHVLGEPEPTSRIHDKANAYTMQRGAGQVDAMPACRRLVDHALLYIIYAAPWRGIGTCQANTLAAIRKARETFVSDAHTLVKSIGAGMAKTAMDHVPAMQTRSRG